ncbi:MAG: hypothetical protein WDA27_14325 [Actinomycetota bacterium]
MGAEYECETCGEMIDQKCPEAHDPTACLMRAQTRNSQTIPIEFLADLPERIERIERRQLLLAQMLRLETGNYRITQALSDEWGDDL